MLDTTKSDLTLGLRTLRRSPRFAAASILTLAIGIGGTTAVFSAVDAVLLRPLPYQEPGQLVRLYQYYAGRPKDLTFVSVPHYKEYRKDLAAFDAAAAILTYNETGADIGRSDQAERIKTLPITSEYFHVLRAQPLVGRGFESAEETDAPVVVLSYALWQRLFHGRTDVLGQSLTMSGVPRTIVGIMPRDFTDPLVSGVAAWVPQDLRLINGSEEPNNHFLTIIARLRPGVTLSRAQAELDALSLSLAQVYPEAKNARAMLVPLKEDLVGSSSRTLELVLGAVALVLLLACVNVANLMLVRSSERSREFALRAALGAARGRLTRQLLVESLVLAVAGGIAGVVLGRALMPVIAALGGPSVPRLAALSLDGRVILFALACISASVVIFGFVPALRASQIDPGSAIREPGKSGSAGRSLGRLRAALVVSQVALALVLLVGAGLLLATINRLRQVDLGVDPTNVLTFDLTLPAARYDSTARGRFYEQFASAVSALPGVRAAGGVSRLPVTGLYHSWGSVQPLSGPLAGTSYRTNGIRESDNRVVSGAYFRAVGIHLVRGRLFDARDTPSEPHRVVISESLARQAFPGTDAVGQHFMDANIDCHVIGVVTDVAYDAEGDRVPMVYHAHTQYAGDRNWALTQVVAVDGSPQRMEPAVRRTLAALDPLLVMYHPSTLDDVIGQGRAQRVFTLRILVAFAAVALVLAALGLFGVLSYTVRLRNREIGIRMALGANQQTIRGMVLRDGAIVTAIGVVIGLAGAVATSRIMTAMLFGVSPLDPVVVAGATVFLVGVAGAAAYLPARQASSVAPQQVLQGE